MLGCHLLKFGWVLYFKSHRLISTIQHFNSLLSPTATKTGENRAAQKQGRREKVQDRERNMAISGKTAICAVVILAVISVSGVNVNAQSPATSPAPGPASPATDCMTLIYNMSDCLTYVEKGSNVTKPDKACCPELAGMLDSNPICLCNLLGKSSDFPVELDLKRALKLPSSCGLQTPPVSLCSGIPVGSPTSSEGPSASSGMSMSPMAMGGGEGVAPSAGKNGASNAYCNLAYLIAALAMVFTSLLTP